MQLQEFLNYGAKPLPEPMLIYCELHNQYQTSMKCYAKPKHFYWRKYLGS